MRAPILILILFGGLAVAASGQDRHWTHPDFVQVQYAGSIGYMSGGAGYDILRNRAMVSASFGHVPRSMGGVMNIFSTRFLYTPGNYILSERTTIQPYNFGLLISYHLGSDFRSRWPSHRYPENYYWWQTSFRFHLNYQPSVTIRVRDHTVFKAITGYLDVNANELYLVSIFQNPRTIRAHDVIKLGVGLRMHY